MRYRAATATLLLAAGLALAGCSSGPSYNEKAHRCSQAIAARPDGDKAKPKACNAVKAGDYDTLNVSHAIDQSGLLDSNGNIDVSKLTDAPTP